MLEVMKLLLLVSGRMVEVGDEVVVEKTVGSNEAVVADVEENCC